MKNVNAFRLRVIRCRCSVLIWIGIAIRAKIKRNDRFELIDDAVARKNILNLLTINVKWTKMEQNERKMRKERRRKKKRNLAPNQALYHMFTWIQACHFDTDFVFVTSFFPSSRAHRNVLFRFASAQPNIMYHRMECTGIFLLLFSRYSIAQSRN